MVFCVYLIVGLLIATGVVCEKLGSAIKTDSMKLDRDYLWGQFTFTMEEINYNKK